jgi:phthalate 4,5-cis-dihydrodiol dehydrogenase
MINVGIIGLGGIAKAHFAGIETLDNVRVVAVADLVEEKRREFMEEYNVPRGYSSHLELLEDKDIDAVGIVLGHQLHHRLTIDACNAGKHVLVEKPMALSIQQCDDMIDTAHRKNVKLMCGFTNHFLSTAMKAKEILDSGELGPIITAVSYMSKNWNFTKRPPQYRSRFHGGGMWICNGVHVVDRLMWMLASQALSVSATIGTRSHYQASDDYATAFVRCKNGLSGVAVVVGYKDGAPNMACEIICTNGSLRFCHHPEKYVMVGKNNEWKEIPFEEPPAEFHHEWKSFAECIEKNIEPPTPGEWGRAITQIQLAAEESSMTGTEVILGEGPAYRYQSSGVPVTSEHGWI